MDSSQIFIHGATTLPSRGGLVQSMISSLHTLPWAIVVNPCELMNCMHSMTSTFGLSTFAAKNFSATMRMLTASKLESVDAR